MSNTELPIANGFYVSNSLPISAQECVNWYPNIPQAPALGSAGLFGTPGVTQLTTTGTVQQANRGAHVKNGVPYFVNGTALFSLDRTVDAVGAESFTTTNLGTIPGTGRVSMADNGTQLCILNSDGDGFIFNENAGTPFEAITDSDFNANGTPQFVVFIDGYFAFTTDSKKFIVSALNNGLAYNALDFGSAEADPDEIVGAHVFQNQLYIFGSQTIESFRNAPVGANFPFQRTGLVIQKGLISKFAVTDSNNSFMFIGAGVNETPAIWQFTGAGVQKISTTAIDNIINDASPEQLGMAFADSHAINGAYFTRFTAGLRSLVYDAITDLWHERKSRVNNQDLNWRANSIIQAYNRIIIGDDIDGRIGELSNDVYTEYGENIIRIVATQPFSELGEPIFAPSLELTLESGVGDLVTTDPLIRLSISRDGKTFGNEIQRSMGKIGEYNRRAIWRRTINRVSRFVVLKFEMSEPVKPVIVKLEATVA